MLAGPGTGKSHLIAARIVYLISKGLAAPHDILALSFSEKSVATVQHRVDLNVPLGQNDCLIQTFHGLCNDLIQKFPFEIQFAPNVKILSFTDECIFLGSVLKELNFVHFKPKTSGDFAFVRQLAQYFQKVSESCIDANRLIEYAQNAVNLYESGVSSGAVDKLESLIELELAHAFKKYQELKLAANVMNFEDQLAYATLLMQKCPNKVATHFLPKYVVVDEFQDMNGPLNRLLVELLKLVNHNKILIVGDENQAIFGFRGASLTQIRGLQTELKNPKVFELTRNFRSSQVILNAAFSLIRNNYPKRVASALAPLISSGKIDSEWHSIAHIRHAHFPSYVEELEFIASRIKAIVSNTASATDPITFNRIAVLVRNNVDAIKVVDYLAKLGVPCHGVGVSRLLLSEEVKLLISYVSALLNPSQNTDLFSILSSNIMYDFPARDLALIMEYSTANFRTLRQTLEQIASKQLKLDGISSETIHLSRDVTNDLNVMTEVSIKSGVRDLIARIIQNFEKGKEWIAPTNLQDSMQGKNIAKFLNLIAEMEEIIKNDKAVFVWPYLKLFLIFSDESIAELDGDIESEQVQVLSVHKSKGLEFDAVFFYGAVESKIPGMNRTPTLAPPAILSVHSALNRDEFIAEERRLAYVALTRARRIFYFTSSEVYDLAGSATQDKTDLKKLKARKVSRFVTEAMDGLESPPFPAHWVEKDYNTFASLPAISSKAIATSQIQPIAKVEKQDSDVQALVPNTSRSANFVSLGILNDDGTINLSYSRADTYLKCPKRFHYGYVLRVAVPPDQNLIFGSALHEAIAAYSVKRRDNNEGTMEVLENVFKEHWKSDGCESNEHAAEKFAKGIQMLRQFHEIENISKMIPTLVEEKFDFKIRDAVHMTGFWDRVDIRSTATGNLAVIKEYKSNVSKYMRDRVKSNMQLQVYALAFEKLFGYLPVQILLQQIGSSDAAVYIPQRADLVQVEDNLVSVAENIKRENYNPTPGKMTCRLCPYRSICKDAVAN